jgi:phenylalanyl-tRNA synthetase alpha chain
VEVIEVIEQLRQSALKELDEVRSLADLETWRVRYLGRKGGRVGELIRAIPDLEPEERRQVGASLNRLKEELEALYEARLQTLKIREVEEIARREAVDVSLPGRPIEAGSLHIVSQTLREILEIFYGMGFRVLEWPEVEWDLYNFELLNMPPEHPARDMWDTFYITDKMLLRTHTSPGQIRSMRMFAPNPVRVVLPGKCYRYEAVSARSEFMFHQVEGLAVGHNITMADLKGVVAAFVREMFGVDRKVRFRCSYFPFTEPSVEVDIDCMLCQGSGCTVCKRSGWLEIMGAGMVHPTVLTNGGYDPNEFTGFAFGMGPERIAMLKYGIDDIRHFYTNDIRFLKQFAR